MRPYRITLHCSASPNGKPVDISVIRQWHLARGFIDVGYHRVIQPDGTVQLGRRFDEQGAHVEGANDGNLGFCLIGTDRFTQAQFDSLAKELQEACSTFRIGHEQLFCHYEFASAKRQGKTCPNIDIHDLRIWYFGDIKDGIKRYLLTEGQSTNE